MYKTSEMTFNSKIKLFSGRFYNTYKAKYNSTLLIKDTKKLNKSKPAIQTYTH